MADGAPYIKQQRLASSTTAQNKKNPSKFCSQFLFKALIIAIFLVTIPLFPSESPEFATSSVYTRGWELLHLILVGIAVSYGLFSRRNDDHSERENNSKPDVAQSYMSRLLQFPSIFDDEGDCPSGSDDNNTNKFQTWSSRYHRNEPLLVVAKRSSVNVEKSGIDEKPLLLPVRSLKSRISDGNDTELVDGVDCRASRVYARSSSMPIVKEFSNGSKRMNITDGGFVSGENSRGSRVYSRSDSSPTGKDLSSDSRRMSKNVRMKSRPVVSSEFVYDNEDSGVSGSLSMSNSSLSSRGSSINLRIASSGRYRDFSDEDMEEKAEGSVVLPSPIPWQSRSGRIEMKGESNGSASVPTLPSMEEITSNRSFKSQSPRSSQSDSSSSSPTKLPRSPSVASSKAPPPSRTLSSESQAKSVADVGRRKVVYSSHLPPPPPPPPPPPRPNPRSRLAKRSFVMDRNEIPTHYSDSTGSVWSAPNEMDQENREECFSRAYAGSEAKASNGIESSSVAKSGKVVRDDEITTGASKVREVEEELGRKSAGYDPISKDFFAGFPKETRDFLEDVFVETDYDSESEDNANYGESEETVENEKVEEVPPSNNITDEGPDVDKKADEFIAKFREQIRLQRIEEIKRSTAQLRKSSIT